MKQFDFDSSGSLGLRNYVLFLNIVAGLCFFGALGCLVQLIEKDGSAWLAIFCIPCVIMGCSFLLMKPFFKSMATMAEACQIYKEITLEELQKKEDQDSITKSSLETQLDSTKDKSKDLDSLLASGAICKEEYDALKL